MENNPMANCEETEMIQGLNFRQFAGEEDYQLLLDLFNRSKKDAKIDYSMTLEDIIRSHQWFDIHTQRVFVEYNGELIGSVAWYREDELSGDINFCIMGIMEKAFWETEIPQVTLDYVERKIREMAENIKTKGEKRFFIRAIYAAKEINQFYQNNGYSPVRYFSFMTRPIDTPLPVFPLPAGFEIRPAKPKDYRKIWEANVEAFSDHWGITTRGEDHYQNWLRHPHFQPQLWKVAWQGDEVCGMVENYIDENFNRSHTAQRGYNEGIFVRHPWRKQGLAKALIAESIRMFKDMGMTETALGVDTENLTGAVKLYTSLGYEVDENQTSMILHKKLE